MDCTQMRAPEGPERGGWLKASLALFLGLTVCAGQSAVAEDIALEDLVRASDTIAYGQVKKNDTHWVGQHLETTTHVKVERYLKGNRGEDLTLTQVGGSVTTPLPITQRATTTTDLFEGEQVILFLSQQPERSEELKKKADPKTGLLATPVLVGGQQGKVSVVDGPDGGSKRIATYKHQGLGLRAVKQAANAAEKKQEGAKKIEESREQRSTSAKAAEAEAAAKATKPADGKIPASKVTDASERNTGGIRVRDITVAANREKNAEAELSGLEDFANYVSRVENLVSTLGKQKPAYEASANLQGGAGR